MYLNSFVSYPPYNYQTLNKYIQSYLDLVLHGGWINHTLNKYNFIKYIKNKFTERQNLIVRGAFLINSFNLTNIDLCVNIILL